MGHDASPIKTRRSLRLREPRSCGMIWRIFLSASLLSLIAYSAVDPAAMKRNTALCVAVGVAGFVAFAQFYIIVVRFLRCVPYSIWVVVAFDLLSVLGWVAAIVVLSYWHVQVLYTPTQQDPKEWRACYNARNSYAVFDPAKGAGDSLNIIWCREGNRLIGNGAARMQLRAVIGLASTSLFFNLWVLYISIRKQRNPYWCKDPA